VDQQQNEGKEYRGIMLGESVKLYKKDGGYNKTVKNGLDILIDLLVKKGHTLLSLYDGVNVKVQIDFHCNHEPHWITPDSYKRGSGCPKCGDIRMAEKRFTQTKEEFPLLVKRNGHTLLSIYKTTHEKVLIDFQCGHEPHEIAPAHYKNGKGCPKCAGIISSERQSRQAREEFPSLVSSKGHTLLTPYGQHAHEKVLIDFHCGHDPHWITPAHYNNAAGCPRCSPNSEQSKEDLISLIAVNGHRLLTDYEGNKTKVLIDFRCGHEPNWITPENYKQGQGCPKCGGRDHELAKEKFTELVASNGHCLLSPYGQNNVEKVLIDFNCGHSPHWIAPNNYQRGKGCPKCSESKGEQIIRKWLEVKGIAYETQYIFPGDSKRYDFMLTSELTIVEVHGIQHYEEVNIFKNRTLAEEQENDQNKQKFAESLGYNYIVVDYRESNPELALERFIEAYNKLKAESTVAHNG
jgi:uncharacterized CHY-type Zn-finger protein